MNTCKDCRGFAQMPEAGAGNGVCKMNPPTVQLVMIPAARTPSNPNGAPQLTAQGFFPPVRGEVDWCATFAARLAS